MSIDDITENLIKTYTVEYYFKMLKQEGLVKYANVLQDDKNISIQGISYNSKVVCKNSIFFAKGINFKKEYANESIEKGTRLIISSKKYNFENTSEIVVNNMDKAMALISDMFYNSPWDKINMTGITGTKGKSTTTYFMKYILAEANNGKKQGHISGISNYSGIEEEKSTLTTPISLDLYRYINLAVENKLEYLTMEVSSQGLKYDRVGKIIYDVGCFLNLGEDHISENEHHSHEDYRKSKMKLMEISKNVCINLDDEDSQIMIEIAKNSPINKKILTFGMENINADIFADNIIQTEHGMKFDVKTPSYKEEFELSIKGEFNVINALCAISICYMYDIPIKYIKSGLKNARVPGRMEIIEDKASNKTIIIDYTHNVMSYKAVFDFVKKEYPQKNIFVVFGCAGNRGKNRRFELGKFIGENTQKCYITENKSLDEPVENICNEISKGVESIDGTYEVIYDNQNAVEKAYSDMDYDGVLIIGNGTKFEGIF